MEKTNNKSNVCGIIGLCTGWLIPVLGLVLGIISLCRKEPNEEIGIISVIISVVSWMLWMSVL